MAGTFQFTCNYLPAYTLSDSRGFSNSAVLFTKTTARFPCSPCLDHKLNGRLKCAPNSRPFVCRASSGGSEHGYRGRDSQSKNPRERFEKWCETHGVVYGGKEEWMKRFEIYQSNIQRIDFHNSLDLPYKLTDNRFADMTNAEFNARYLCEFDMSLNRDERMLGNVKKDTDESLDEESLDVLSDADESLDEEVDEAEEETVEETLANSAI